MKEEFYKKGTRVLDLLTPEEQRHYVCCKVNGVIKELDHVFLKDTTATVEFLDLTDSESYHIYEASLRYITAFAIHEIDNRLRVRFFYNVSRAIFCRIENKNFRVTEEFVHKVDDKIKEIIAADLKIDRIKIPKAEAIEIYKEQNDQDKIKMLNYRKEDFVHMYKVVYNGHAYYDYLFCKLVPFTGSLNVYALRPYAPGFLLQSPRYECNGQIPPFTDEIKFASTLAHTSKWSEMQGLDTAANINNFIKKNSALSLINVAEARFSALLTQLSLDIYNSEEKIRLVCIAGPSSSGKTSFSNRLMYQLMVFGLNPIRISIDDFYIPRGQMPEGTDIESVDALDIKLFNDTIYGLIQGKSMALPRYEFKSGERTFSKPTRISLNDVIIIEGIHALNSVLTQGIPEHQKYRVYIAPQSQVNIDNHSPLSMTDLRLLRRIARDARTRDSDAKETISMWPNVRNGEFKYIYPTQENADYVFDTFLPYEVNALKEIVLPLLDKITPDDDEYLIASRLRSTVKLFTPIPTEDIPCNSLLREFVGGSSFKDAR